ncbi:MAG: 50S ribosomal protein L22 [Spirochaetaceae bacterium]|nr:50S ribosomal protein L22 [Spirochaetaceae bacterium]
MYKNDTSRQSGYRAEAKYLPMAASKIRPVADLIRNKPCEKALAILEAMPQKGAFFLKKALKSAIANAMDRNAQLDESVLSVTELKINEGPQTKRMWPRSHGRADRLIKRSAHIVIVVDEKKGAK